MKSPVELTECPRERLLPRIWWRDEPNAETRELVGDLGLGLCIDGPAGVCSVSDKTLSAWGMTYDEAARIAWSNWRVYEREPRTPCPVFTRLRASESTDACIGVLITDGSGYAPILALSAAPIGAVILMVSQECCVVTEPATVDATGLLIVTNFASRLANSQRFNREHFLCDESGPVAACRVEDIDGIPRVVPMALASLHFGAPS